LALDDNGQRQLQRTAEDFNCSKIDLETFVQRLIKLVGRDAVVCCCETNSVAQVSS
jgi:hypothetical protein